MVAFRTQETPLSQVQPISVQGLRSASPETLKALTQDLLLLPIGRIETSTLVDLLALSELEGGLSAVQTKDLVAFRDAKLREVSDLPDGTPLAEFCGALRNLEAGKIPQCLREHLASIAVDLTAAEAIEALSSLMGHIEDTSPEEFSLPDEPVVTTTKVKAKAAPKKRKTTTRGPSEDKVDWITDYVIGRLSEYGERGLKEAIVVAGTRHKAPWDDLTDGDVMSVVRKLKREEKVRHSAGRWIIKK